MRPLIILGTRQIVLDGRIVSYTLKRSPRARYVRLEVRPQDGLTIIVPRRYDLRHLDDVLRARARWILRKIESCIQCSRPTENRLLASGDSVPYLGQPLRLRITSDHVKRGAVVLRDNDLLVIKPVTESDDGTLLELWYRHQANTFIRARADLLAGELGIRYGRITIRAQQTRWASCSPKGNLSFNWRLMMAPEKVVDYVIIHELTHLTEMNHTARFWRLLETRCPNWTEQRKWLSEHGSELSSTSVLLA